jgi:hypothetical protein
MGRLGYPLGTYLTIEGVRAEGGKGSVRILEVSRVNGETTDPPTPIWVENIPILTEGKTCVLNGYESGKMIGVPDEVAQKENLLVPQAGWQLFHYFIVTSVEEPTDLEIGKK